MLKKFAQKALNAGAKVRFILRDSVDVGNNTNLLYYKIFLRDQCRLSIGYDCDINCRFSFDRSGSFVSVGNRCYIGSSHIVCAVGVSIGDDVIISWGVTIVDHDSHALSWADRSTDVVDWKQGIKDWSNVTRREVTINDKVWIGFNVSILKGVTIGEGAIVGAGSVVTGNVDPYTIVAGNPARFVRAIP